MAPEVLESRRVKVSYTTALHVYVDEFYSRFSYRRELGVLHVGDELVAVLLPDTTGQPWKWELRRAEVPA